MIPLERILEIVATMSCGIFAGAAIYINVVEHPARMSCGTRLAATEFGPSYHRAAVMQASLAIIGFLSGTTAWLMGSGWGWLLAGICLVSVVPFTLAAIMPTNRALLHPDLDKESESARSLLVKWNRLHAVRSILSLLAFAIFALMR